MIPSPHSQAQLDYERIERALRFIDAHVTEQPRLAEIADHVHLSPFHFDRLFSRWAGTSPQRFLKFLTKEYAKQLLAQRRPLPDVAEAAGLSGPGRLHDLFVTYEAFSPGEYRGGGAGLIIEYGLHPTPFGPALLAQTARGICHLSFLPTPDPTPALTTLRADWPEARLVNHPAQTGPLVQAIFAPDAPRFPPLVMRGTNFQIKVWEALLTIPAGQVVCYEDVAAALGRPGAQRAVGTAIGRNPIAYLIPCHRVIQKLGTTGQYRWGSLRKRALLGWEAAQHHNADFRTFIP
jgi:AraC family transcriptional regulator of adaptative response/methylated-DNA-[protein]-cysteine methyltransferase